MCCTGYCKYEGYHGDCVWYGKGYPEDAACVIAEKDSELILEEEKFEKQCEEVENWNFYQEW